MTTFLLIATIALGLACGFGAAIYVIVGWWHRGKRHHGLAVAYILLALAYIGCTYVIAGRQIGYCCTELPQGTSLLLFAPIVGIPPAIQWVAWLKARRLLREQRGG